MMELFSHTMKSARENGKKKFSKLKNALPCQKFSGIKCNEGYIEARFRGYIFFL